MTYNPTKQEIERVRDAAMKIIAERDVAARRRMPGKAAAETTPCRRAEHGNFIVVYVPEPESPRHHHVQIVRANRPGEPLAKIDWDDFGGLKSWPLLPGKWQRVFVAGTLALAPRKRH